MEITNLRYTQCFGFSYHPDAAEFSVCFVQRLANDAFETQQATFSVETSAEDIAGWIADLDPDITRSRFLFKAHLGAYHAVAWKIADIYEKARIHVLTEFEYAVLYEPQLYGYSSLEGGEATEAFRLALLGTKAEVTPMLWQPTFPEIATMRSVVHDIAANGNTENEEYESLDLVLAENGLLKEKIDQLRSIPEVSYFIAAAVVAETDGFALLDLPDELAWYGGAREDSTDSNPYIQQAIQGLSGYWAEPVLADWNDEATRQSRLLEMMLFIWQEGLYFTELGEISPLLGAWREEKNRFFYQKITRQLNQNQRRLIQLDKERFEFTYIIRTSNAEGINRRNALAAALEGANTILLGQASTASARFQSTSEVDQASLEPREYTRIRTKEAAQLHDIYHEQVQHLKALEALETEINDYGEQSEEISSALGRLNTEQTRITSITGQVDPILNGIKAAIISVDAEFSDFPFPRDYDIGNLDDGYPILLMPIRVETRFMNVRYIKPVPPEIDSVGPTETVQDKQELWVRMFPDEVMYMSHEADLTADEQQAGKDFWDEIWEDSSGEHQLAAWRAMSGGYGTHRAAWIIQRLTPTNLGVVPTENTPQFPSLTIKQTSWSEAAYTEMMPDEFVVRLYRDGQYREVKGNVIPASLTLGLIPDEEYENAEGNLQLPEAIAWLTDFHKAVEVGMAVQIPLIGREATEGFDRIVVLGVKKSLTATQSQQLLEKLIDDHHYTEGMAFLPTGTPTNHTKDTKAAYSAMEDRIDERSEVELGDPLFMNSTAHFGQSDGQRFAELLGINEQKLYHIESAGRGEISEAMAMNRALWSASLGYYLEQMLAPLVSPTSTGQVREFFEKNLTGRGHLPSFRVGKQPYGVLLTSAFSRWAYPTGNTSIASKLYRRILKPLNHSWESLLADVDHIGSTNASPDTVPSLLAQHASSVSYFQRSSLGEMLTANLATFANSGSNILTLIQNSTATIDQWLKEQGFSFGNKPRMLNLAFGQNVRALDGPLIDTSVLSEIHPIAPLSAGASGNYIEWLSASSLDRIRSENYFNLHPLNILPHPTPPQSLLYLLLRHAIMLEYVAAAYSLIGADSGQEVRLEERLQFEIQNLSLGSGEIITAEQDEILNLVIRQEIQESSSLLISETDLTSQVNQEVATRESALSNVETVKWNFVENMPSSLSGSTIRAAIDNQRLQTSGTTTNLPPIETLQAALEKLKSLPTARLERLFAEHVDITSYRLDAWFQALAHERLQAQRETSAQGLYLGAFGWLENLRPGNFPGTEIIKLANPSLDPAAESKFLYVGKPTSTAPDILLDPINSQPITPPIEDPEKGFIHAPSVTHAATGAILRNAFLSHQEDGQGEFNPFAVDLSSDRIRRAIRYLDAIRAGSNLGAVSGYELERLIYDDYFDQTGRNPEVDLRELRETFSLVAGSVTPSNGQQTDVRNIEARQVIDGLKIVEAFRKTTPVWHDGLALSGDATAVSILETKIKEIIDTIDAISDLGISEAIYQLTLGNHDRAAGVLAAINGDIHTIQEFEVIETQRRSVPLTHKVAIHFDPNSNGQAWPASATIRSLSEPRFNRWLSTLLPPSHKIRYNLSYTYEDAGGTIQTGTASGLIADLDFQPIDLMFWAVSDNPSGDTLSQYIRYYWLSSGNGADHWQVQLDLASRTGLAADEWTITEVRPLLREAMRLLSGSRSLRAEDLATSGEATQLDVYHNLDWNELYQRIAAASGNTPPSIPPSFTSRNLATVRVELQTTRSAVAGISDSVYDTPNQTNAENALNQLRDALMKVAAFGMPQAIPVSPVDTSSQGKRQLIDQADQLITLLQEKEIAVAAHFSQIDSGSLTVEQQVENVHSIADLLFGGGFKLFPCFQLEDAAQHVQALGLSDLLSEGGDFALEEWIQGVAKVRPLVKTYHKLSSLTQNLLREDHLAKLDVIQLSTYSPSPDDRWVGTTLPADYDVPPQALSLVSEYPAGYDPNSAQSGILIDEWTESIPAPSLTSALAANYDQPNSEPPQTLLLAVTPSQSGNWDWKDLMDAVVETIGWAKKRAIDPEILQNSGYSQILPTIISAISGGDDAPSLDLARNVRPVPPGASGPVSYSAPNGGNSTQ